MPNRATALCERECGAKGEMNMARQKPQMHTAKWCGGGRFAAVRHGAGILLYKERRFAAEMLGPSIFFGKQRLYSAVLAAWNACIAADGTHSQNWLQKGIAANLFGSGFPAAVLPSCRRKARRRWLCRLSEAANAGGIAACICAACCSWQFCPRASHVLELSGGSAKLIA